MSDADKAIFGVDDLDGYVALIDTALLEYQDDQSNFLRAYTCCLLINHLPEWVAEKTHESKLRTHGYPINDTRLKFFMEEQCAELNTIRKISNGLKHLKVKVPTDRISGFGQGPFGVGPFGKPYLLASHNSEPVSALALLTKGREAWNVLFEKIAN